MPFLTPYSFDSRGGDDEDLAAVSPSPELQEPATQPNQMPKPPSDRHKHSRCSYYHHTFPCASDSRSDGDGSLAAWLRFPWPFDPATLLPSEPRSCSFATHDDDDAALEVGARFFDQCLILPDPSRAAPAGSNRMPTMPLDRRTLCPCLALTRQVSSSSNENNLEKQQSRPCCEGGQSKVEGMPRNASLLAMFGDIDQLIGLCLACWLCKMVLDRFVFSFFDTSECTPQANLNYTPCSVFSSSVRLLRKFLLEDFCN